MAEQGQDLSLRVAIKIVATAILYFLTGELGLLLAVPPGYATVIWPASGIAVGATLAHGRLLAIGVFAGSFFLNAMIAGAFAGSGGWMWSRFLIAAAIAAGSTTQALVARRLSRHFIGSPLNLERKRDVLLLFLLTGPVSCLVASTVGVATLSLAGLVQPSDAARNWFTWWIGDVVGVLVFLPIVLLAPAATTPLQWRGEPVGSLPTAAILVVLLPLGLTFYAWKASSQFIFERNKANFASVALENEQALRHRLASYNQSLLGALGYVKASDDVSAGEWRTYVRSLDVEANYPGINGVGLIQKVAPADITSFLADAQKERQALSIHPKTEDRPYFIIKYIEPAARNWQAIGLNIAFEDNRLKAALLAQDTGAPTITKRIVLTQDRTQSSGFLLLHPMYRSGAPTNTVGQRRDALVGWIYAALIARNFMDGLTLSQGEDLNLSVYDGDLTSLKNMIYESDKSKSSAKPIFVIQKPFDIMQSRWTFVWRSTPRFEAKVGSNEPYLALIGGLVCTALFATLLFTLAHRAEAVRKLVDEKTHELSEREALYRLLAENSADMISRVALDGMQLYTSPACKTLLGYEADELISKNVMSDVCADQRSAIEAQFAKLTRGEIDDATGVFTLQRKDGGLVEAEIAWHLVRDKATGQPFELVVTKRDVTVRERKGAELKLATAEATLAKSRAEQASEAKTAFLASMSHEIRTPLNGIIGYTDFLLDSTDLPDSSRRHVERIATSGAALLSVVNDILDFSRIESGQIELDVRPFALEMLVDSALSIVRGVAVKKGLDIADDVHSTCRRHVLGDESRLRQILLNLLNNAVKFTAKGQILLTVDPVTHLGEDGVRFAVRDSGIGIPLDKRDRLFKRFSQVDGSVRREFGGTGLGLAISKHLIELMGGAIGVESVPSLGSTFWFELILPAAAPADISVTSAADDFSFRPARILLVDDTEINRDIASAVLRNAGYEVDTVADGANAIVAVQTKRYDLVFMDIQMPEMDGMTATRLIRMSPSPARDVPVVALTANVLPFQVEAFLHAGMLGHVGKPFKKDELLGAVARFVNAIPAEIETEKAS